MAENSTTEPVAARPWLPFALVIAAAALAHLWCLGSQFFMDDMPGIRDSKTVRDGDIFRTVTHAWTHLGYHIQYKLFGMSPVAFHAVNWLLHTANACVLLVLARDLLIGHRGRDGIALFAALLFAAHPLCSEIPNYARCQDLAWVTLFSLLASWGILRYLRSGNLAPLAGFALAMAGATMSKGPGFFHAAMMSGVVALISLMPEHRSFIRKRAIWAAAAFAILLAVLWGTGVLPRWLAYADTTWHTPRFIGHAYTLARVFWEFAWRAVIPVKLSADHQIAEINRLEAKMRQLGIREETNHTIWGYFNHARATVMEMAGNFPEALESMRFDGVFKFDPADIRLLESRIPDNPMPAGP